VDDHRTGPDVAGSLEYRFSRFQCFTGEDVMPKLLFLSRKELESLLDLRNVINVVKEGFVSFHQGKVEVFPVVREFLRKYQGIFGIKSGFVSSTDYLGFKAGGYWKNNPKKGIPGHQSLVVLYSPETGIPQAVMDGNFITIIRTGAVGALAAQCLARKDSSVAAILGCGTQGRIQLTALREVFRLRNVRCYDSVHENARLLATEMSTPENRIVPCSRPEEAVTGADIIVTTTPSMEPIVRAEWVSKGAHINAMGADTKGKQEIYPELYQKSKVVVDDLRQCSELGETQHNLDFVRTRGIYAQLGEILSGNKPGRENDEEITLFDATGIAFQDLVTAGLALALAKEKKMGTWLEL
jgi:alanine dehydrogenase